MCGRYGFIPDDKFYGRFSIENRLTELTANYNAAPGQMLPVVTKNSPNRAILMKWGLIPFWARDPGIGNKMINARIETIGTKPAFRKSLLTKRCLIPANGFYEWKKTDSGKIPYYFKYKDNSMFAFAGLYDIWQKPDGEEIKSYTILTTKAEKPVETIHDRMPVILEMGNEEKWLDKSISDETQILTLVGQSPSDLLETYPVSTLVNNIGNNDPSLIKKDQTVIDSDQKTLF